MPPTLTSFDAKFLTGGDLEPRKGESGTPGPQGVPGVQGTRGEPGPQGPAGPLGEQGHIGPHGAQGRQGNSGQRGPQGVQGPQGIQGQRGRPGAQGSPGPQGEKGQGGSQGPMGPGGPAGPRGEQGEAGQRGPQGSVGPRGEKGEAGPHGEKGESGPRGVPGKSIAVAAESTESTSFGFDATSNIFLVNDLQGGVSSQVDVLCVAASPVSERFYAGSHPADLQIGGTHCGGLAEWNGKEWHGMGTGISGHKAETPDDAEVQSIHVSNSGWVYVAGRFLSVNGVETNNIAVFDPSVGEEDQSWHGVGLGLSKDGICTCVTTDSAGHVYAVGTFSHAYYVDPITGENTKVLVNGAAYFDGVKWSALRSSLNDSEQTGFNFENGEYPTVVITDYTGSVYIGGVFASVAGIPAANIVKFTRDEGFTFLGPQDTNGVNELVISLAVDSYNNLYVGGDFDDAGGLPVSHLAKWNGTEWSSVGGNDSVDGKVASIAITSDNKIYISGSFDRPGRHLAFYDGAEWHTVGNGMDGFARCMEVGPTDRIILGGPLNSISQVPSRNIGCLLVDTVPSIKSNTLSTKLNESLAGLYELSINPHAYGNANASVCGNMQRLEICLGGATVLRANLPLKEGNTVSWTGARAGQAFEVKLEDDVGNTALLAEVTLRVTAL